MLADDLDAQINALEEAAPDTPDVDEAPGGGKPGPGEQEAEGSEADGEEWTPPDRATYENVQKAMRAEREQRRMAQRQAAAYEQNIALIEQRVQDWQRQQMAAQLHQPGPDPYTDPDGARAWQLRQQQVQQQFIQAEHQRAQAEAQAYQQEQAFAQLSAMVDDYETEFTAQNPDYHDATEHLLNFQTKFLESMGYPRHVAEQQTAILAQQVAEQALRTGRNPAEVAYQQAKQVGYQSKNGQTQNARDAAAKLEAIKAGQQSGKTLSGGGASHGGAMSLKTIAKLEGAAFDSAMEKYLNDQIRGR